MGGGRYVIVSDVVWDLLFLATGLKRFWWPSCHFSVFFRRVTTYFCTVKFIVYFYCDFGGAKIICDTVVRVSVHFFIICVCVSFC